MAHLIGKIIVEKYIDELTGITTERKSKIVGREGDFLIIRIITPCSNGISGYFDELDLCSLLNKVDNYECYIE